MGVRKFKLVKPPSKEPLIKLVPMIKLIGNAIVSSINKLTLALFELFWIPISNKKKKVKFIELLNKNFFNLKNILIFLVLTPTTNYKSNFSLGFSFLPNILRQRKDLVQHLLIPRVLFLT